MDNLQDNLLTSSDYEEIMTELRQDNNFPMHDNQQYAPNQMNTQLMGGIHGPPNQTMQNFSNIECNDENVVNGQSTEPSTLEPYMPQNISEAMNPVQSSTPLGVMSSSPTCTMPCRDHYPGPLNFEILLDATSANRRSWVYSLELNKVFIDMNKSLLVQFRIQSYVEGLRVRALPVFSSDDNFRFPVPRCDLHILNDDTLHHAHSKDPPMCFCANFKWVHHVVRSNHKQAQYEYDCDSDRHSVVVPLEAPQAGTDTSVVEYHFSCKTSCPRGMSRKPIDVIFTLETEQQEVIGRYILPVKICSCPKRDKDKEEADLETKGKGNTSRATKRRIVSKRPDPKQIKLENGEQQKVDGENDQDTEDNHTDSDIVNVPQETSDENTAKSKLVETLNSISVQISSINNKLDAGKRTESAMYNTISSLSHQVCELSHKVTDVNNKMDISSQRESAIFTTFTELNHRMAEINHIVSEMRAEVSKQSSSIETILSAIYQMMQHNQF